MTKFDLAAVREFAANLDVRMNQCDNGEGTECMDLDNTLRHYASLCCEFRDGVRQWGQAVFRGRIAFDPEVERVWKDEGTQLYNRACDLLSYGDTAEIPCYVLDGVGALRSSLLGLHQLLTLWVTPKLAVAPSARQKLEMTPSAVEEAKRRIAALPPLPADWQPTDPTQKMRFKKLRLRSSS